MKILLFFMVLSFLYLTSCSSDSISEEELTPHGFKCEHYIAKNGEKPKPAEYVYFHVDMRNGDSVTYSSRNQGRILKIPMPDYSNPASKAKPSPVMDALSMMSIGDSLTVYQRLDTLPRKPAGYENADELAYDLVLLDIKTANEYQADMEQERKVQQEKQNETIARLGDITAQVAETVKNYAAGKLNEQLQTTKSGLKYIIHEQGTGKQALPGHQVDVQYYGVLTDGKMFDNSFQRGASIKFPLGTGRVIKGWDEGIALLKEGAKATLFLPSDLAYGAAGSPPAIPPNAELIFYIELEKVQ